MASPRIYPKMVFNIISMSFEIMEHCDSPSAFESFLQRSANMTKIWENITSDMSATDVARCLKTCKLLRWAMGQCLSSNSKFKRKMDSEATSCAIKNFYIQTSTSIHIKDFRVNMDKVPPDAIVALDHTWYYNQCSESGRIGLVSLCPDSGKTVQSSYQMCNSLHECFSIQPTMNPERVHVMTKDDMEEQGEMLYLSHGQEEDIPAFKTESTELKEFCDFAPVPRLLKYRIFVQRTSSTAFNVLMAPVGDDGRVTKPVMLYQGLATQCEPDYLFSNTVLHRASNEQAKMLMFIPGLTAVCDIRNGEVLWQRKHEEGIFLSDYMMRIHQPFITDHITGYLLSTRENGETRLRIKIYDTASGDLIASHLVHPEDDIHARGPYVCYQEKGLNLIVFKMGTKKKLKGDSLRSLIEQKCKRKRLGENLKTKIELIGFLGKTNVVIGQLIAKNGRNKSCLLLFSLNLDYIFTTTDELDVMQAFSFFPTNHGSNSQDEGSQYVYGPVYKTNRTAKSVDLVGVMKMKKENGGTTVETNFFATEMQCPTEY